MEPIGFASVSSLSLAQQQRNLYSASGKVSQSERRADVWSSVRRAPGKYSLALRSVSRELSSDKQRVLTLVFVCYSMRKSKCVRIKFCNIGTTDVRIYEFFICVNYWLQLISSLLIRKMSNRRKQENPQPRKRLVNGE